MAVETVPASSSRRLIVEASWFRFIARLILALLGLWALVFARDRFLAWGLDRVTHFRSDMRLWLSWLGVNVGAGILFGLATSLPFTRVRYAWSRLLLAAIALVPIVQLWWVVTFQLDLRPDWFLSPELQFALAALAGVAISSGFRAKGSTSAT